MRGQMAYLTIIPLTAVQTTKTFFKMIKRGNRNEDVLIEYNLLSYNTEKSSSP